jgi:nitrogen fixation protein NifX
MKIAFATTDGSMIDEHFGRAGMFAVYDLTADGYRLLELRKFAEGIDTTVTGTRARGQVHDDTVQAKVDRLADCRIVYLTEIGGPSAARLVRKGIMPLKVKDGLDIGQAIRELHASVVKSPPPWLKKAMNG